MLLEVAEPGVDRRQVCGPHLVLDVPVAGGPQQRHGLDRRERAIPRRHRRLWAGAGQLLAGLPPLVQVGELFGCGQPFGPRQCGVFLGAEPAAEVASVRADPLRIQGNELAPLHRPVKADRLGAAAPP
jgi:hypothetical protein